QCRSVDRGGCRGRRGRADALHRARRAGGRECGQLCGQAGARAPSPRRPGRDAGLRSKMGPMGRRTARGTGAPARRQGPRAPRRPERRGARGHSCGGAAGAAAPGAAELSGRGGRDRRRCDHPPAPRSRLLSVMIATLDPRVLSAISDLELVARVTVDGTIAGLHRSPFHGYSAEFSQYRPYRAGDDLKYVDWKLYARTDRFYTKQFRETTNLLALMAMDASGSMSYAGSNGVTKATYARLLGAALSHLLSGQGDGIGLVVYDAAVRQFIPSRTGRSHVRSLLVALSRVEPGGRTAAAAALTRASELLKRRGFIILFSDLYDDEEAIEKELRRAVRMGHEVAVFHVLTPEEGTLGLTGEAEGED